MNDPNYIETKLSIQTNSADSEHYVSNNRYYYRLLFKESIGWDWLDKQVSKVAGKTETSLEPYKLDTGEGGFVCIVRELERREHIDDQQHGLGEFDES